MSGKIIDFPGQNKELDFTVCAKCKHFRNLEPHSVRADIWYNHICMASPFPKERDPYDGEVKPYATNALGQKVFCNKEFAYCRDVNNGQCELFAKQAALRRW